ncbi:hypothetical protein T11_4170 [Trichinella zimbabwensis]|uniref:Uncharacterized protein n=1 Tax=Trichinella zimbabwensis TaxID=268475 RepID=A0A0V1GXY4_9BILA|nr:hypothetical protein T11_4170 [Trichinella zimbabwensis]
MQTNIAFLTNVHCTSLEHCASALSNQGSSSFLLSVTTSHQNSRCVRDFCLNLEWIRHAATVATFTTSTKSGQYHFFLELKADMLMTTNLED